MYNYICVDSENNIMRQCMWSCNFEISSVPSVPLDLRASCTGPTSISISWSTPAKPNGILLQYNVYAYFKGSDLQDKHEVTADPEITYNSFSFTNLVPNAVYVIKVSAETRIGEGARAVLYNIIRDHGLIYNPPPSFAETINSTAIKLSWDFPETAFSFPQNAIVPPTGFIIYHNVTNEGKLIMADIIFRRVYILVFQDLMPFTFYRFSVSVYFNSWNGTFCSKPSNSVVARTDEDCKILHTLDS